MWNVEIIPFGIMPRETNFRKRAVNRKKKKTAIQQGKKRGRISQ